MKVERNITTNVTLSKKEVDTLVRNHIKTTQGIDVTDITYVLDMHETLELVECVCRTKESVTSEPKTCCDCNEPFKHSRCDCGCHDK